MLGMRGEQLKGHLDLLILGVLQDGAAHGYAVIRSLKDKSRGTFNLQEGTVYPALHRLEEAGLVVSRWARAEGRRRRGYEITREGKTSLSIRLGEWLRFQGAVDAVTTRSR